MQNIKNLLLLGVALLLAAALLTPGLAQAKEEPGSHPGVLKERIAKDLGLTPEQTKAFMALGEKYNHNRQDIIAGMKKNEKELEQALAAPKPDEAKIRGLVAAITAAHDQLWESFRFQRQQEMALLNPVQQGKFLMSLKRWHQEMCVKYEKPGQKK